MSCSKEHNANLTSECQPFLIPKISFSPQPLEVGFLPQATAYPTQTSATTGQPQHCTLYPPTPRWFSAVGRVGNLLKGHSDL